MRDLFVYSMFFIVIIGTANKILIEATSHGRPKQQYSSKNRRNTNSGYQSYHQQSLQRYSHQNLNDANATQNTTHQGFRPSSSVTQTQNHFTKEEYDDNSTIALAHQLLSRLRHRANGSTGGKHKPPPTRHSHHVSSEITQPRGNFSPPMPVSGQRSNSVGQYSQPRRRSADPMPRRSNPNYAAVAADRGSYRGNGTGGGGMGKNLVAGAAGGAIGGFAGAGLADAVMNDQSVSVNVEDANDFGSGSGSYSLPSFGGSYDIF